MWIGDAAILSGVSGRMFRLDNGESPLNDVDRMLVESIIRAMMRYEPGERASARDVVSMMPASWMVGTLSE